MVANTRRILFVESDESLRLLVQRVLSRYGVEADLAAEAPEAIRRLAAGKYQVVVVDLLADGGEAYELVRALSMIPPATRPIVIATGDPAGDARLDADVISLVVRKPYDVQALSELITSSMSLEMNRGGDHRDDGLHLC
jgi:CheY-like chemotaxis protein